VSDCLLNAIKAHFQAFPQLAPSEIIVLNTQLLLVHIVTFNTQLLHPAIHTTYIHIVTFNTQLLHPAIHTTYIHSVTLIPNYCTQYTQHMLKSLTPCCPASCSLPNCTSNCMRPAKCECTHIPVKGSRQHGRIFTSHNTLHAPCKM